MVLFAELLNSTVVIFCFLNTKFLKYSAEGQFSSLEEIVWVLPNKINDEIEGRRQVAVYEKRFPGCCLH